MTTPQMIDAFIKNHSDVAMFIAALDEDEFQASRNGKWSPGQQLQHLILCLKPIMQAIASAAFIKEKFGTLQRPGMDYTEVLQAYQSGLLNGGKAPERFLPGVVTSAQRQELMAELTGILSTIRQQLQDYNESQLDTLVLPHPFLGMLSIRELFFLMSYHPLHHLMQIQRNLGPDVAQTEVSSKKWFDRKFTFDHPLSEYPAIYARLVVAPIILQELLKGVSEEKLTEQPNGQWSLKEHAGHLTVLEPLWRQRIQDIATGTAKLTPADLNNEATSVAGFNNYDVQELVDNFTGQRKATLSLLGTMEPSNITTKSLHPRMQQEMSLTDHLYFVAEHDEHHFNYISRFLKSVTYDQ